MLIARLIADPAALETQLDAAVASLQAAGMPVALARMLDSCGDVLEIGLPDGDPALLRQILDTHFAPADVLVSKGEVRLPHVFVSDMDSTMIGQECIDELADFAGLKDHVSAITERAMKGELDFAEALQERVELLEGLDESAIQQCLEDRISPVSGARTLVATLKSRGCRTVLVTGGFHHFADPVAALLGFDRVVGNRLRVDGGKLAGQVIGKIVDSAVKEQVLRDEMAQMGPDAVSLATGDGANDIPMLVAATYGFAYRAKPKARAAADGWVDRGNLTAILSLLGVPASEWVAG